jgi:acetyl esterase/lipase
MKPLPPAHRARHIAPMPATFAPARRSRKSPPAQGWGLQASALLLALAALLGACSPAGARQDVGRDALLSPDGRMLAWRSADAILIARAASPGRTEAIALGAPAAEHEWTLDGQGVIARLPTGWVYAPREGGLVRLQRAGARLRLIGQIQGAAVFLSDARRRDRFDLVRIALADGRAETLIPEIAGDAMGLSIAIDRAGAPAALWGATATGQTQIWLPLPGGAVSPIGGWPLEDALTTRVLSAAPSGEALFLAQSTRDRPGLLVRLSLITGARTTLAEAPAEITAALFDPESGEPLAIQYDPGVPVWRALVPAIQPDLAWLTARLGAFSVTSQSGDGQVWLVASQRADRPGGLFRFERGVRRLHPLRAEGAPGPAARPVQIRARDGLVLPAYLTLPPEADTNADGAAERPSPIVLLVHGGPWLRDRFGHDGEAQALARQGYGVLRVNFRGSVGFGRAFLDAGDRQWGRAMQTDLEDAIDWAVKAGAADPLRVAVAGHSYGGYAALSLATTGSTPIACAVALSPVTDLAGFIEAKPANTPDRRSWNRRVGDPETAAGRAALQAASPVLQAERARAPILIGHGGRDANVPPTHAQSMTQALRAAEKPVSLMLLPREGHLLRAAGQAAWTRARDSFLARCLKGPATPPMALDPALAESPVDELGLFARSP